MRAIRLQQGHIALRALGVTPQDLLKHKAPASHLLHLPNSKRKTVLSLPIVRVWGEKPLRRLKSELALSMGTETVTFAHGSYIRDPLKLINKLCRPYSDFLCIGGDSGAASLKLGVTYLNHNKKAAFLPLFLSDTGEKYEELAALGEPGVTNFSGESAQYKSIWALLQSLVQPRSATTRVFLNGDWKFINTILGLKSAAGSHPCPICTVHKDQLATVGQTRVTGGRRPKNPDCVRTPLLTVPPLRIVPTPLHVALGVGNRIIEKGLTPLLGETLMKEAVRRVKTVHRPGYGGLSDIWDLNGPELQRWVHKNCTADLMKRVQDSSEVEPQRKLLAGLAAPQMNDWLSQLPGALLNVQSVTDESVATLRALCKEIHACWQFATNDTIFPKLHMLHHTHEFAQRWRILGLAAESQIESSHARIGTSSNTNHYNKCHDTPERLRRCHADFLLQEVAPLVQG